MTSINEPYTLASFNTHEKGLSSTLKLPFLVEAAPVIGAKFPATVVTVQRDGIHIYNTQDQQCIQSYPVGSSTVFAFASRTLSYGETHSTYAVFANDNNQNSITRFYQNGNLLGGEFEKSIKLMSKKISFIETHESLGDQIVVIFNDSSISLLSMDLEHTLSNASTLTSNSESPIHVSCISTENSSLANNLIPLSHKTIIAIVTRKYEIILYSVNEKGNLETFTPIKLPIHIEIRSFSLDLTCGNITVLDSNNVLSNYSLIKHFNTPPFLSLPIENLSSMAISRISNGLVSIVGESVLEKSVFSIWDMKYGTLQGERIFSGMGHGMKFIVRCLSEDESLIISSIKKGSTVKNNLYVVSYIAPKSSILLHSINKLGDTRKYVTEHPLASKKSVNAHIETDLIMEGNMDIGKDTAKDRELDELLKISGSDEFSRAFFEYIENRKRHEGEINIQLLKLNEDKNQKSEKKVDMMDVDVDVDKETLMKKKREKKREKKKKLIIEKRLSELSTRDKRKEEIEEKKFVNKIRGPNRPNLSYECVSGIAKKCFSQSKPFSKDVIEYLGSKYYLSSSMIEGGILSKVISWGEWKLGIMMMKILRDIPEKEMVKLLEITIMDKKVEDEIVNEVLMTIARVPKDGNEFRESMNQLSIEIVEIILFKVFDGIIGVYERKESEIGKAKAKVSLEISKSQRNSGFIVHTRTSHKASSQPSISQAIELLMMILDSRLSGIILNREGKLRERLEKLNSLIRDEIEQERKIYMTLMGPLSVFGKAEKIQAQTETQAQTQTETQAQTKAEIKIKMNGSGGNNIQGGISLYAIEDL